MIRGFQGEKLSDPSAIAACAKHFVGYGAAELVRNYNSTFIPERLLRNVTFHLSERQLKLSVPRLWFLSTIMTEYLLRTHSY